MFKMADSFEAARGRTLQAGDNVRQLRETPRYVYGSRQPNVDRNAQKSPIDFYERNDDHPRQQMG